MRVLILAFFAAHVAEGYFLASSHIHFGARDVDAQQSQPVVTFAFNKPVESIESKTGVSFASRKNSPKYPVIEACHLKIQAVFGKYSDSWYVDWKLWVGLTLWFGMWAKWLSSGFDEIYWQFFLFAFGVNIVILHILQYTSSVRAGMLIICALLTGQAILQSYLTHLRDFNVEACTESVAVGALSVSSGQRSTDSDEYAEFDCDCLYLDLGLPIEQIIILFVAQCGVWWFYMTSILNSFSFDHSNFLFWLWAFLVMQMTMIFCRGNDSALGNAFPVHDVHRIWKEANKVSFSQVIGEEEDEKKAAPFQISRANILARGVMGFFCNCILREIMAYTIPLMLMGFSEPMDFVVYCVGVNFICTLDDMSERKYKMFLNEVENPLPAQDSVNEDSVDKGQA